MIRGRSLSVGGRMWWGSKGTPLLQPTDADDSYSYTGRIVLSASILSFYIVLRHHHQQPDSQRIVFGVQEFYSDYRERERERVCVCIQYTTVQSFIPL